MTIDLNAFTPFSALAGGALIGLSAAMLILFNGRIAGISGVLGGLLQPRLRAEAGDLVWRIAFIAGLLIAPLVWQLVVLLPASSWLTVTDYTAVAQIAAREIDASAALLIVAGLLVGIGTRYGAGCTSGHGVCGLSRLSLRSLVATLTFMSGGFATVYVMRHLLSVA